MEFWMENIVDGGGTVDGTSDDGHGKSIRRSIRLEVRCVEVYCLIVQLTKSKSLG
jgi:hypothetical protein